MATRSPSDMPILLDSDTEDEDDPQAHSESDMPVLLRESSDEEEADNENECEEQRTLRLYALLSSKRHQPREQTKAEQITRKEREAFDDLQRAREQKEKKRRQEAKERQRMERHERKEAKKRARKAQERKELLDACTDSLVRGLGHYHSADYKNALSRLQFVEKSVSDVETALWDKFTSRFFTRSQDAGHADQVVRYMTIRCALETDYDTTRGTHLITELEQLLHDFPVSYVYWLYGRAMNKYQPTNERTETILSRASSLLCELQSEDTLVESDVNHLRDLINVELQIWQNRPTPDGICNSAACSSPKIYWGGDDVLLCSRITCSLGHCLLFHKSCWRNVSKRIYGGSRSRDDSIGELCPAANGCSGDITRYEDLTNLGIVRTSYEAALQHVEEVKEVGKVEKEDLPLTSLIPQLTPEDDEEKEMVKDAGDDNDGDDDDYTENPADNVKPLVDAFAIDISSATVIPPRDHHTKTPRVKRETVGKKKRKDKATMSLGEFWKTEEEKEAIREEEKRMLKAQLPVFERDLNDLHETVKLLARRPTKKLSRARREKKKDPVPPS